MGDKYSIELSSTPSTTYVNKTVHEHRAPTDDSIRLYKEMKEKAIDSVMYKGTMKNICGLGDVEAVIARNLLEYKVCLYYNFTFHDKKINGCIDLPYNIGQDESSYVKETATLLQQVVINDISEIITHDLLNSCSMSLFEIFYSKY